MQDNAEGIIYVFLNDGIIKITGYNNIVYKKLIVRRI